MKQGSFVHFVSTVLGVVLTLAQRVLWLVGADGVQPPSLETEDDQATARTIFGPIATIPDIAREVLVVAKGARVGGSMLGAYRLLHLALTAPLDMLAPGERASALIVGPDLRLARQAYRYALGAARQVPAIRRRIVGEPASDAFTLKRSDGREVVIECLPATRGGSAVRGRTLVAVLLTEAAFFRGEDSVINDLEIFKAVAPRIVKGGQIVIESTPWTESGLLHDLYVRNWAAPTTALAAHCPTLVMRDDDRTRALVERERQRDADNAVREFDAQFMSGGAAAFFDAATIAAAIDPTYVLPDYAEAA